MIKLALLPASFSSAKGIFIASAEVALATCSSSRARWTADRPQHRLGTSVQHLRPLCRTAPFRSHPPSKNSLKNVAPSLQDAHDPFLINLLRSRAPFDLNRPNIITLP